MAYIYIYNIYMHNTNISVNGTCASIYLLTCYRIVQHSSYTVPMISVWDLMTNHINYCILYNIIIYIYYIISWLSCGQVPNAIRHFLQFLPQILGSQRLLLDTAESRRGPVLEGGPSAKPLPSDFEALITTPSEFCTGSLVICGEHPPNLQEKHYEQINKSTN